MLRPPKSVPRQYSETRSAEQVESWLEERLCRKNETWKASVGAVSAWRYYCPFCGVSRALKSSPSPQLRHLGQVLLTTGVFTTLLWPFFGLKGIFLLLPFWVIFELGYRLRIRAELSCKHCGFDPTLYLSDAQRARREMAQFWEKKGPRTSEGSQSDNRSLTSEKTQS